MTDRATVAAMTALGALLGHHGGDYLVQTDWCARHKQQRTRAGRWALAVHAGSYAMTQAVTKMVLYRSAGVRVPVTAQVGGAVVEAVLHAAIDDGRLLALFARVTGKAAFHGLADHGINGRALMDQALHHQMQMVVGVVATVAACGFVRHD